jgi:hypothetical protein
MEYILKDVHYEKCDLFDVEMISHKHDINNYNVYEHPLFSIFKSDKERELVIQVLDYLITNDTNFIFSINNKTLNIDFDIEKFTTILSIFSILGIKKYKELKDIYKLLIENKKLSSYLEKASYKYQFILKIVENIKFDNFGYIDTIIINNKYTNKLLFLDAHNKVNDYGKTFYPIYKIINRIKRFCGNDNEINKIRKKYVPYFINITSKNMSYDWNKKTFDLVNRDLERCKPQCIIIYLDEKSCSSGNEIMKKNNIILPLSTTDVYLFSDTYLSCVDVLGAPRIHLTDSVTYFHCFSAMICNNDNIIKDFTTSNIKNLVIYDVVEESLKRDGIPLSEQSYIGYEYDDDICETFNIDDKTNFKKIDYDIYKNVYDSDDDDSDVEHDDNSNSKYEIKYGKHGNYGTPRDKLLSRLIEYCPSKLSTLTIYQVYNSDT